MVIQMCTKCKITKDESEYYRRNTKLLRKECKKCAKEASNKIHGKIRKQVKFINEIGCDLTDAQIEYLMSRTENEIMEKEIKDVIDLYLQKANTIASLEI